MSGEFCRAVKDRGIDCNQIRSSGHDIRDLKHRQRNARRRRSQPKEDWVEGFVLGGKKES